MFSGLYLWQLSSMVHFFAFMGAYPKNCTKSKTFKNSIDSDKYQVQDLFVIYCGLIRQKMQMDRFPKANSLNSM